MDKIKKLSIRKSIVLYISVALIVSYLLAFFVIQKAEQVQRGIVQKYVDLDAYYEAVNEENDNYKVLLENVNRYDMSDQDLLQIEICDFLITYSILVLSLFNIVIAVILFYRNKIQKPLNILESATEKISKQELNFKIQYDNPDELGALCIQFEHMRDQLEKNQKEMWKMMEQEKALKAAIAHDIRSPLTILEGYQEMLLTFLPEQTLDVEKLTEMVRSCQGQTDRMDAFIHTMSQLTQLEEREVSWQAVSHEQFADTLQQNVKMLCRNSGKKVSCQNFVKAGLEMMFDQNLILEVVENLVSNAIRYAQNEILIKLELLQESDEYCITIEDDGTGFQQNSEEATKLFYHANPQDELKHFGLGLYVSRVYCEKHGGKLLLGNRNGEKGASVKAFFYIKY